MATCLSFEIHFPGVGELVPANFAERQFLEGLTVEILRRPADASG